MEIKDLKEKNVFVLEDEEYTVKKIEVSKIGKHGKAKVRIEAKTKSGDDKILIRVSDEQVEKK